MIMLKERVRDARHRIADIVGGLTGPQDYELDVVLTGIFDALLAAQRERAEKAIDLAVRWGGIDGAHHKAWVIDQMVRALADDYPAIVRSACDGEDGPNTYDWDTGIAP